jgi:AraC-like DNA-binding protein
LPAEHYRLFVKACNNSGVWSEETELASFTIREHPLRSNLAVVLYTILAFLLVWLLLRWQISRTERKSRQQYAQQLDTAVTQVKEEELDDRVQLLTSLSEQLEAPVTGIGLQLEKVKAQPKAKEALAVLEKNHRMLRSIVGNLRQMRYTLERQLSGEAPVAPVTPDEEFISRLDGLIADHLADPNLSVGFLAQEMAISRSSLFSKTKELTGETPNNLINQARLNLAANLLAEGRYNVGEICYMAGFSSPSYFSKIFVSQYGITPHEWAKKAME